MDSPDRLTSAERVLEKIGFLLEIGPVTVGVDQIEPLLDDLLTFILANLECRSSVESKFIELMETLPQNSIEMIEYCMHTLQWQSVRDAVADRLGRAADVTKQRLYRAILQSFAADWKERMLYSRYD